jgi:hypothetical protein
MASNKWEKKFSEEKSEEQESTNLVAQRLINIFRQLHILNEEAIQKYNTMLLQASPDVIKYIPILPGGEELKEYLDYIKGGASVSDAKEGKKPQESPLPAKSVLPSSPEEKKEQPAEQEPKKPIVVTEPPVSKSTQTFSPEAAQQIISAMMEVQQQAAQHQTEIISKALGQTQENLAHLMANTVSEIKGAQAQQTPVSQTESPLLENLAEAIKESQEQTNKTLLEILTRTQAKPAEEASPTDEASDEKETAQNSGLLNELLAAMAETQIKTSETQAKIIAEALAEAQETQKKLMEEQSFKLVQEQAKVLAQAYHDAQELARQQLDVLSRNLIDAQEKFAQKPNPIYVGPIPNWVEPRNQTFTSSQAITHSINQNDKGLEIDCELPSFSSENASFKEKYTPHFKENYPSYERAAPPKSHWFDDVPASELPAQQDYQEFTPTDDFQEYIPEEEWQTTDVPQQNFEEEWQTTDAPQQNFEEEWQTTDVPQQNFEENWQTTDVPQQNFEEEFIPETEQSANEEKNENPLSFENEQENAEQPVFQEDWQEMSDTSFAPMHEYAEEPPTEETFEAPVPEESFAESGEELPAEESFETPVLEENFTEGGEEIPPAEESFEAPTIEENFAEGGEEIPPAAEEAFEEPVSEENLTTEQQENDAYTPFSLMQADTSSLSLKEKQIITQVPPKSLSFSENEQQSQSYVSFQNPTEKGPDPYASFLKKKKKK